MIRIKPMYIAKWYGNNIKGNARNDNTAFLGSLPDQWKTYE